MNQKISTKKIVLGGMFLALSLILPQVFHIFGGPAAGKTFLPMHIPVLLAGFFVGPYIGAVIGLLAPVLSSLVTGMPMPPILYFMILELGTYGLAAGWFFRKLKWNVYISLILSMISGRIIYTLGLLVAAGLLKLDVPPALSVFTGIAASIPGLIIQVVLIPAAVLLIERRMKIDKDRVGQA
jgi:ECF transporter S component (folate family)